MSKTAPIALARPELTAWRNSLFVLFALCGIGLASWAARIPTVSASLGLTTGDVGVLLFGIAAGSIGGLLVSSHLIAAVGTRTVITWALIIGPLGLTLAAVGATVLVSFPVAIAGLAVFGAALGACDVSINVSGAANERAIGRNIMPIYHAFFSIGTIAGALVAALTEQLRVPLEVHIGGIAVVSIIAMLASVRFLRPEPVSEAEAGTDAASGPSDGWRGRLSIWRNPRTIFIGLIVLGMAFTEGSANDWLAYAMVEGHNTDKPTGALVFGVFVTAMTVGRLGGVRLLDRFGRVPVLRVSAVLAAIGLITLIFVPVVWIAVIGVVLWGLGASLGFPVGMSAAADDPRTAAASVSAVATIGYVAFLVGPPVIGFLGEQVGILNGLLLVLVLVALAGVFSHKARELTPLAKSAAQAG
ncbi:MFS transporter [Marisediminicola antarctica]|uniref:MFS transporter n=1 Tax=Marisediminicola antarctica TaxID=674079 RepID=UPI00192A30F9|nr:MFS transporter [Marisediminicola antarctica]